MRSGQRVKAEEVLPSEVKKLSDFGRWSSDHLRVRGKGILSFNLMQGIQGIAFKLNFAKDDLISWFVTTNETVNNALNPPAFNSDIYFIQLLTTIDGALTQTGKENLASMLEGKSIDELIEQYKKMYLAVLKAHQVYVEGLRDQFLELSTLSLLEESDKKLAINKTLLELKKAYEDVFKPFKDLNEKIDRFKQTSENTSEIQAHREARMSKLNEAQEVSMGLVEEAKVGDMALLKRNCVNNLAACQDKFNAERHQKNAALLKEDISNGERNGEPVTFIPLQESNPDAIKNILATLGDDWESTELTEGPAGFIATLYNKKYLELDPAKKSISVDKGADWKNGQYRIDFFITQPEGSPLACANMHLNFEANYPFVLSQINQATGSAPVLIAGDANHEIEGQIGACVVSDTFRKNAKDVAFHRVSDVILIKSKDGKLSLDETQVALDFAGREVDVEIPQPSKKEQEAYPLVSLKSLNQQVAAFSALDALIIAIKNPKPKNTFPIHLAKAVNYDHIQDPFLFSALTKLLNNVTALVINPNAKVNGDDAVNEFVIAGIKRYLANNQSDVPNNNINRMKRYHEELQSPHRSSLHKKILAYAVLASEIGKTHFIASGPLSAELRKNIEGYIVTATKGDKAKLARYHSELDKLVAAVNSKEAVPDIHYFDLILRKPEKLIDNIMGSLALLDSIVPATEGNSNPHTHQGIKDIQLKIQNRGDNTWDEVLKIAQKRVSPMTSALSGMSFFPLQNARDPKVDLMYRAIAEFEKNWMFNPGIETLAQLMNAQRKREVIAIFQAEIERLMPDHSDNLLIKSGVFSHPSDAKVEAYKNLIQAILKSDKDETVQNVLDNGSDDIVKLHGRRGKAKTQSTSEKIMTEIQHSPLNGDPQIFLSNLHVKFTEALPNNLKESDYVDLIQGACERIIARSSIDALVSELREGGQAFSTEDLAFLELTTVGQKSYEFIGDNSPTFKIKHGNDSVEFSNRTHGQEFRGKPFRDYLDSCDPNMTIYAAINKRLSFEKEEEIRQTHGTMNNKFKHRLELQGQTNPLTLDQLGRLIPEIITVMKSEDFIGLERAQQKALLTKIVIEYCGQQANGNPNPFPKEKQIKDMINSLSAQPKVVLPSQG